MTVSRSTLLFLLVIGFLALPLTSFAQVGIWPSDLYKPPGDPSCFTIWVDGGAYVPVYLEVYTPWGGPDYWYFELDGSGQTYGCVDEYWAEGQYVITGVYYYGSWYSPAWASFTVHPAPQPPPAIYALGSGCDNWDCVWATGTRFHPDSRVLVYSADWAYSQTYYGPAWGGSPPLYVDGSGELLYFQVADANLRQSFGWNGLYLVVLNSDGTNSDWRWVQSPQPAIDAATPTCADFYCIELSGVFPLDAYVDFRVPGSSEILPNAYTDLSVTSSQITLRLNPGVRYAFDTSGLNTWVVNPAVGNWSSGHFIPPVDRAVIGNIDGISQSGPQYYLNGWACAKTYTDSIDVHVYRGGAAGSGGTYAFSGTANLPGEPALAGACNSGSAAHRFSLLIPDSVTVSYGGQGIYVYGISPFGLSNLLIANSGTFTIPSLDRSITGQIDGIGTEEENYFLSGWACAKTYSGSIDVHVYVGGPAGVGGIGAFSGTANQASDAGIRSACNSTGSNYRFRLQIPPSVIQQYGGQPIFVHGISPFGLPNLTLANSGNFLVPGEPSGSLYWKKDYIKDGRGLTIADARPQPSDSNPPTIPSAVECGNPTSSALTISWTPSSDAEAGVAGYLIYRGMLPVGAVASPATTFVDDVLQPQTGYGYRVVAVDHAGNPSDFSSTVNCQTQ